MLIRPTKNLIDNSTGQSFNSYTSSLCFRQAAKSRHRSIVQSTNCFIFLVVLIFSSFIASGQYSGQTILSLESLYSSGNDLPFWFSHNQSGRYDTPAKSNQLFSIQSDHRVDSLFGSPLNLKAGVNFISSYSDRVSLHFNELYATVYLWNFKLEGGRFRDSDYFSGLSSSNGNLARSLNARPYPKIRFATQEFIPFFFFKKWFSYKAEYDEGWLGEKQYVKNAHLHHKSLYARIRLKEKSWFTFGLDHYVMWGGISPEYGALPDDFNSYLRYVTGRSGSSAFPETDQQNVAGNQFGAYLMQFDQDLDCYTMKFYYSHPFEDHSGMEMDNWRDNLLGVSIDLKRKAIVEKAVYEFMYTQNQSGSINEYGVMRGRDDYFNHGYYKSGYTYLGYTMASPLFSPVLMNDTISIGIENTRLSMHHIGLEGSLSKDLCWYGLFTYTHNLGTYNQPYTHPKNQFSTILTVTYRGLPVDLSLSLASDMGQLYENRSGMMIKISRNW